MLLRLVHLQVDLCAEHAGKLLVDALPLVADKVLLVEVIAQRGIVIVELIRSVGIAKVAKVVLPAQVAEELVPVHVADIAVLAQRMATVRFVVDVALAVVQRQIRSCVAAPLKRKDL